MQAALLKENGCSLSLTNVDQPKPEAGEVLLRVRACGVCRTDLHIVDGELKPPRLPIVPGHQIVGEVVECANGVTQFDVGERIGVPWLGSTCGRCDHCRSERENLCDSASFTGFHQNGGFAEWVVADAQFCFPLDSNLSDIQVAPLLCGGLIGYRAYRMAGEAKSIGFYGFGSAAHILIRLACYEGLDVYAFTRPDDNETQQFARNLGAVWAGGSDQLPKIELDAAIIFAPIGPLVPQALQAVRKGGRVICAGIHMSDIPSFPYNLLWGEREIRSVANLTRRDGIEFLKLAAKIPITTTVEQYSLAQVNQALEDLKAGRISGSAVIEI